MIKNYTSNSANTFRYIEKCLVAHKAKHISFEYDNNGKIKTLVFALDISGKMVGFKLPANVEAVERIFKNEGYRYKEDQPYKTAWANIKDWLEAQMALIDTQQVKIEEVFLPYAVNREGKTYFEVMQDTGYQLQSGE